MAYGSKQLDVVAVRRGWLRAAAIGLLASLTTFFALHAAWRPGVGRSLVQASLRYEPGEPATALDLDEVRAQMTSAAALQEALRSCGQSGDSANVADWQAELSVYRTHALGPSAADQVIIELPTRDEAGAIAVVQALAQRFLSATLAHGGLATQSVKELTAARQEVTKALAKEDTARRELDAAVKDHLELLRESQITSGNKATLEEAKPVDNPTWLEQAQKIAALEKKRDELLENLTPAHPKVRDMESELEELQSRLSSTPRYLERQEAEQPPEPELATAAAPMLAEAQQRINAAQDAYATARAARLEAQAAVEVLEHSTAEAPSKAPRFLLAQSAQAVHRDEAISPVIRYGVLLLAGTLVLLATVYALRPQTAPQVLRTVEDVSHLLRLPVIAKLKVGGSR